MKYATFFLCAAAGIILSSCSSNDVSRSSFLTNYSQLGPDVTRFDSAAVYLHPTVDFKKYDSVMVDSVTLIPAKNVASETEMIQVAARLQQALVHELSKDYKVVSTSGPTTMRLRVALTGELASGTGTEAKRFTYPNAKIAKNLPNPSDGAKRVGSALMEVEVVDSSTNERLLAVADKRLGALRPDDKITTWEDISGLMSAGGVRTRQRLQDLRARILN